jgi:ribose/xylose/arabinose/galactoside ABC-type transport system permease subunit
VATWSRRLGGGWIFLLLIALIVVFTVAAGAFWGLVNGFLIAMAKIPALIVTLGTLGMALGIAQIITGGLDVRAVAQLLVAYVGTGKIAGIPALVAIAAVVTVIGGIWLHLTRFGERTFAVGSHREASWRSGIPSAGSWSRSTCSAAHSPGRRVDVGGPVRHHHDRRAHCGQPRHHLGCGPGRDQPLRRYRD